MRISQTYTLDQATDGAVIHLFHGAFAAMAGLADTLKPHQYFPAWIGTFKRTGEITDALIDAMSVWARDMEKIALSDTADVARNGAMWSAIKAVEDAIGELHRKAAISLATATEPRHEVSDLVRCNLTWLGSVPPVRFPNMPTDRWLDVWGETHGNLMTLQLRYGSGMNHCITETRTIAGWQDFSETTHAEGQCWHDAIACAYFARLIERRKAA